MILEEDNTCYNTPTSHQIPPDPPAPDIIALHRTPAVWTMFPTTTSPAQKYNSPASSPNQPKHQIPSPHQYYALICDNNRAKLQQKYHDHLVHDAYSKKKQKREKRILISSDGNSDSRIPTKYPLYLYNSVPEASTLVITQTTFYTTHTTKRRRTDPRKNYITTE